MLPPLDQAGQKGEIEVLQGCTEEHPAFGQGWQTMETGAVQPDIMSMGQWQHFLF
jgi:uncharacterized protein (DUF1501 family)